MARPTLRCSGTPLDLDEVLRPLVRALQLLIGGGLTVLLVWLAAWAWVPIPVALVLVSGEAFFWMRGDRPIEVTLGEAIEVADPKRGTRLSVDPAAVRVATVYRRPRRDGTFDAFVILADDAGVVLAFQLHVGSGCAHPGDVDVVWADRALGGVAGVLRVVAPRTALCRQLVEDPDGKALAWLREHLPAAAWTRAGARLWRGTAPPVNLLGIYEGPPATWIELDGTTWRLADGRSGATRLSIETSRRTYHVLREEETFRLGVEAVPVLVLDLGGVSVAIPAPRAGALGPHRDLDEDALHTHVPEGASLVWHILRTLPREDRPELLSRLEDPPEPDA